MEFWVYENWPTNKAMIHEASCPYCNHGRGVRGVKDSPNGIWHGPFSGAREASDMASRTGRRTVRGCKHCMETYVL